MNWLRALDTVADIVSMRGRTSPERTTPSALEPAPTVTPGQLEIGLVGVVVGALKEALDRDRERTDEERQARRDEVVRHERLVRRELQRQHAERVLSQARTIALAAAGGWLLSMILLVVVWTTGDGPTPGRAQWARGAMAAAWGACAFSLVSAFLTGQRATARLLEDQPPTSLRDLADASLARALWALLVGLSLAGVALLLLV